jgi:hypothetical protein
MNQFRFKNIIFLLLFVTSCTIVRKAPIGKPYIYKNPKPEIIGGSFTKLEKEAVSNRLMVQLDDSAKAVTVQKFFISFLKKPVAYDSVYTHISAKNMEAPMFNLGYYNAKVKDTAIFNGMKVTVKYTVIAGNPTLIDTMSYRLKLTGNNELQNIALSSKNESYIVKNTAVTKTAVLAEIGRLVDSFRNNGYYKFTASELRMRGDSTIAALTTISDDPFEQLNLLNEAQKKKDSPTVKLALVINKPEDTTKLNKYRINKIYVLSDFRANDLVTDTQYLSQIQNKNFTHLYHDHLFKTSLLERNLTIHNGDIYKQDEYYRTLNNLSKLRVWQSVNIRIIENLDSTNQIDMIVELVPGKKLSNVNSLELSYSSAGSNSNAIAGSLFGVSLNATLENRNFAKEAIKMSHNIRFGIEFNNKNRTASSNIINSNEASYSNTVAIPRFLFPRAPKFLRYRRNNYNPYIFPEWILSKQKKESFKKENTETFINTNFSYNNRLNLFSLQSIGLNYGYITKDKKGRTYSFKILNADYSFLFNQSDSFINILNNNPFLRYSYNTSFAIGMAASYSSTSLFRNLKHPKRVSEEGSFKLNVEESGLTWGLILSKINVLKRFAKLDAEYKYTINYKKTALVFRSFAGIGVPLFKDSALPFFKQFYGGGSNSMRGWPIRGIGRGSQKLNPLIANTNTFNDRTGDIQFEFNAEYRHNIARLIPNVLNLKGAAFVDIGNIWNFKSSKPPGVEDETQFKFKNFFKDLGLSAGYGLRFDFTYLVLRTDFGFRFKRPETSDVNNGWKAPDVGFNDIFQKILSKNFRDWRYENFNFSIGINYPF